MPRLVAPVVPAGRMRQGDQPVLAAPGGLTLRPWLPSDATTVLAAYADPDIRHWHRRGVASEDEARELIARWNHGWAGETTACWAVLAGGSAEIAGRVTIRDIDLDVGQGEVGYWVLPSARGGGVAVRAVREASRWALEELGLHRLELGHSVANTASCRVADKAGFRLEATLSSALLHADGWHDLHLHALTGDGARGIPPAG
jgi:[ribosomal protein S5]-alanine N-acetyltransferase